MTLTEKNHYNPCFWTAYWNFEYLREKRINPSIRQNVREIKVDTLNLKSNKLLICKTENIFYQKKAGIAVLSEEGINKSFERMFPNENIKNDDENLNNSIIDFENHFTMLEETYKTSLEKIILTEQKLDLNDRVNLSTFVAFQLFRNPNFLDEMTATFKKNDMEKFELFMTFKSIISKSESLIKFIGPYLFSEWKIYRLSKNILPLSDNPIMIRKRNLMVAIAPNILLEMNLKIIEKNTDKYIIKKRIRIIPKAPFI